MAVTLSITSDDLGAETLQDLTRDLCRTLNRETDVTVTLAEESAGVGTKGDLITVGQIILTFLSSGAAVAMFGVLKSYFERSSSTEMEFQREDGKKLVIRAENVDSNQLQQTIELARDFFGGSA